MYGKTSFPDRAPLADTMAVFCLPFRRCWSGRKALVAVLLIAVYVTLMVHQPADPPIVTRPVVWPLFADISAGRSVAAGRTTAGRPADFVSPAADQVPVMTQRASQQPLRSPLRSAGYPVDQNADQKVDQKVDQASDQVDSTRGNNDSEGLSNSSGDGARGGDDSRTSVGDSDGSSDSPSDRDTRCAADRAADDSAGLPCAESERHGPAQRVISYSLFQADGGQPQNGQGDQDGWGWLLKGLDANAELSVHLYPGWRIRVYHDTIPGTSRRSRLAAAACRHRHIDLCYVRQQDRDSRSTVRDSRGVYRGALWRFFPLSDPLVDAFVSRDLDSRLSQREVTAVHHWLATNRTFHIMRDHWEHLITVPGGLWGARPSLRRPLADKLGRQLDKWLAHPGHKNWDQRALHSVVWFHAAVDSVQHDSYTCQRFPGYTVPFPSRRAENDTTLYLGQVVRPGQSQHDEKLLKCPPVCRPDNHPDWEYC